MDGKLIGLVRDALIREYGEGLWGALANRDLAGGEAPSDSLACWLGRHAVPALADTYPSLFERHDDLTSFISGLGDDLPVAGERSTTPVPLSFRTSTGPDGQIFLRLEAACSVCAVIQGVIAGAAVHYGEPVTIQQIKSRRHGDNVCLLQIEIGDSASVPEIESFDFLAVGNA
ncbi:MAG: hypothetical protein ACC682_13165 [Gemmatimonadota bacterium]